MVSSVGSKELSLMYPTRIIRLLPGTSLFLLGLASGLGLSARSSTLKTPSIKTILENNKVLVREMVYEKDAHRPVHQRQNDEVIVFVSDAQYEVVYPDGKKETRIRKAGEVIWHNRGETAPNLTNTGRSRYRTIVVNLK
jgi:hypothetical protein